MTPKQRVLSSLNWQKADRVPVQIYLTPEIKTKLISQFRCGNEDELLKLFGVDFRHIDPVYRGKIKKTTDGVVYDMWGSGYRWITNSAAGTYKESIELPLAGLNTMDDVQKYPWPSVDEYDFSGLDAACEKYRDYAICLGVAPHYPDILNGVSRGRGMERVIMDIALRDEVGLAIIDKRVEHYYQMLKKCLELVGDKIDIVYLGEDCGNQNGRMFSPTDFDEIFRPYLQKFFDLAHRFGCKAMMHSCGDTHEIMPAFMEMGLDVLDSVQPEPVGMRPENIWEICKGKLALCGLISTQHTLPHGTVEDCRTEARHRLEMTKGQGGYIFAPSHWIQPDTPTENIIAAYEEALGRKLTEAVSTKRIQAIDGRRVKEPLLVKAV